ncbi:hypothetical protein GCM10010271_69920 [Streptomyces kurssanovii]|nr:hypothetical protein GCM10010271_69920 [Streptomyces kurssanovii]
MLSRAAIQGWAPLDCSTPPIILTPGLVRSSSGAVCAVAEVTADPTRASAALATSPAEVIRRRRWRLGETLMGVGLHF